MRIGGGSGFWGDTALGAAQLVERGQIDVLVCGDALGGGGIASLRFDPQGKALAQILLEMPIAVPVSLAVSDPEAT